MDLNKAIIQLYVVFLLVSRRLAIRITNKNIDESYEMFIDRSISPTTTCPFSFLIAYVKIARSANQKCIYVSRFCGSSYEDRVKSAFSRFTEKRFENLASPVSIVLFDFHSSYLRTHYPTIGLLSNFVDLSCYFYRT